MDGMGYPIFTGLRDEFWGTHGFKRRLSRRNQSIDTKMIHHKTILWSPHRSGRLPGAFVFSGKTTRVFNRPPRSRGRVLDVNFWFSRILGFVWRAADLDPSAMI